MANIITSCRIVCSVLMLFYPVFSVWFNSFYILGGFTDMIDGAVARKKNTDSKFGAKLDTIADFVFTAVALIKILPAIHIPTWLWVWIIVIAIIKIGNVTVGFKKKKIFVAEHTLMNKITGILLFLLPMTLHFIELKYSAVIVCSVATVSAIQEGHYIKIGREIV